jgi:hypothetical protein
MNPFPVANTTGRDSGTGNRKRAGRAVTRWAAVAEFAIGVVVDGRRSGVDAARPDPDEAEHAVSTQAAAAATDHRDQEGITFVFCPNRRHPVRQGRRRASARQSRYKLSLSFTEFPVCAADVVSGAGRWPLRLRNSRPDTTVCQVDQACQTLMRRFDLEHLPVLRTTSADTQRVTECLGRDG